MQAFFLCILAQVFFSQSVPVDPARIEAEIVADADVLRSLQQNGDIPAIARPVDVRFVGSRKAIANLKKSIGSLGWRLVQHVSLEGGNAALDVQRSQTTDMSAIRDLTEAALRIETQFGVYYDGWGTVATKQ